MLNKITISILLCLPLVGITTSYANQTPEITAETSAPNTSALRVNIRYVNVLKTPNVVLNETYKAYVNDFESRYKTVKKSIDEYNKTQDLKLKPLTLKINQKEPLFVKYKGNIFIAMLRIGKYYFFIYRLCLILCNIYRHFI